MKLIKFLLKLSIRNKLILIIVSVTITILIIGVILSGSDYVNKQKEILINQHSLHAQLIGEYCITPMTFGDTKEINEILSKSRTISNIISIRVLDKNLKQIAFYSIDSTFSQCNVIDTKPTYEFKKGYLHIYEPIVYLDKNFGFICMTVSTISLGEKIKKYFLKIFLILIILSLATYVMAIYLQKLISKPIIALSEFTNKVSENSDYTLKIKEKRWDEIGVLYNNFNKMLEQINTEQKERDKVEKKLQKEKLHAQQSDKLKSAFLANMSHEIRTPMNSISGFSELIADEELESERRKKYVSIIRTNCDVLSQLINDIIDIAKIEADQLNINIGPCPINDLLKEIYLTYKENIVLQEKEIDLNLISVEQNITILSDEFRLRQVLLNLIGNAYKFTKKGFIEFGCNLFNEELLFYVKDTGIGIPKQKKKEIFNRFQQADGSHSRKYGGTGLGLSISKSIIDLLGGKIWVDSEVDTGSTFYFTIPNNQVESQKPKTKKNDSDKQSYEWKNKKILIAEDNATNYQLIEELLRFTKVEIYKATNGKEAIEVFKENDDIDLILMDINMPILNGYKATKTIKKINKNVVVISITAFAMAGEKEKSLKAGCDDYISKPIKSELLFSKIDYFFSKLSNS